MSLLSVAIIGRPNVGKSTLFNRIIRRPTALVDGTAGVTRDRHYGEAEWLGYSFQVIDTGGVVTGQSGGLMQAIQKQTERGMVHIAYQCPCVTEICVMACPAYRLVGHSNCARTREIGETQ